ncbi:MAG: hypothetical protein AMJ95_05295 [Omnitrophica WOR_2 bacterium SM23_72]|nr:MAG: hypothetical protein AMJ95_05295 [Omnitrophica WOR_2 bacterium SM23_72]
MITISNLSKHYGPKILFNNISLGINRNEKIGLIGPNGSGKSTLFSLILREIEPSQGRVRVQKNIHIGYLPQEAGFISQRTCLAELTEGDDLIMGLKRQMRKLEEKNEAGSRHYGEVLHRLETLGYFELEPKAKKILMGLGFKEKDFGRPIHELSGGWQMRCLLGKLLCYHYDLLLLDEPTNYLDLNAALWLKEYLLAFKGTFIIISHDKAYLNDVTNYSLILENGTITKVHGNYEQYERIKAHRHTHLMKQFKEQEKKREQLQRFIDRFHAQPNKAAAVRAKRTQLAKMKEIIIPPDPRESIRDFRFPATRRSGHRVMTLKGILKSYGDIQVYRELDFEVTQGQKAVLAGENGAGKSTLLKILAGVIDIDSGERIIGPNVDIGYFSQTRMDVLSPQNSVLQEAYSAAPGYIAEEIIRTILGVFLFTGEDAEKKVGVLSGGEKSRLILAKLLINPPNFLLLDEPTTHLDVDAIEALIKALTDYEGTIVFISHDIYFVRSMANTVFEVRQGRVRVFPGEFDYYLEKKDTLGEVYVRQSNLAAWPQKKKIDESREKAKEEERRQREEVRKRKIHNARIGKQIEALQHKKEKLRLESYAKTRALSRPRFYEDEERAKEFGRRLKEIERLMAEADAQIEHLKSQIME